MTSKGFPLFLDFLPFADQQSGSKIGPLPPNIPGSRLESAELWLSCLRELGLHKLLIGRGGGGG